jgi:hypothetical protein
MVFPRGYLGIPFWRITNPNYFRSSQRYDILLSGSMCSYPSPTSWDLSRLEKFKVPEKREARSEKQDVREKRSPSSTRSSLSISGPFLNAQVSQGRHWLISFTDGDLWFAKSRVCGVEEWGILNEPSYAVFVIDQCRSNAEGNPSWLPYRPYRNRNLASYSI